MMHRHEILLSPIGWLIGAVTLDNNFVDERSRDNLVYREANFSIIS